MAPLFYIQNKFWGNINNIKLEHIVIDEAQDLGEFQFYNFKELVKPNMSMTILGDIAQGIYSYKGTNNWQKLNQNVFNNQASIEVLKESYRTSMEIIIKVILEDIKLDETINLTGNQDNKIINSENVFIVHGHNDEMKISVARTLEKLKLKPIILHEQPSKGKTIIALIRLTDGRRRPIG